jgi:hypothetical protein
MLVGAQALNKRAPTSILINLASMAQMTPFLSTPPGAGVNPWMSCAHSRERSRNYEKFFPAHLNSPKDYLPKWPE